MNFKDYQLLGDKDNRKEYRLLTGKCEICGSKGGILNIHHHIKQQKAPIELFINYSLLCQWNCHRLVHANYTQFDRELKVSRYSIFYKWDTKDIWDYMHKLKGWEVSDLYEQIKEGKIIIQGSRIQEKKEDDGDVNPDIVSEKICNQSKENVE